MYSRQTGVRARTAQLPEGWQPSSTHGFAGPSSDVVDSDVVFVVLVLVGETYMYKESKSSLVDLCAVCAAAPRPRAISFCLSAAPRSSLARVSCPLPLALLLFVSTLFVVCLKKREILSYLDGLSSLPLHLDRVYLFRFSPTRPNPPL